MSHDDPAARVKEEPEWEDNTIIQCLQMKDRCRVKVEWESEAAPLAELDTELEVKQEVESRATPDHIKKTSVSDKTLTNKADVYTDNLVKEILVAPEKIQRYKQLIASQELTKEDDKKNSVLRSKPLIGKPYKCDHCYYDSDIEESVRLHEKIHYTCVYCKYIAASEVSLLLHVSKHASGKPKTYARRSYAGAKQRSQGMQASLYTNQLVKKESLNETSAQDRVIEHEVKVEPESCGGSQADQIENEVKVEIESGTGSETGQIQCEVKEEQEQDGEEHVTGLYAGHTVKDELVVGPDEIHRPKQVASEGSTKQNELIEQPVTNSIINENLLILHDPHLAEKSYKLVEDDHKVSIKSKEQPNTKKLSYKCFYCKYTNANKNILQDHQRKHMVEEPFNSYKCSECSFVCARRSQLRYHKSKHTEKPFKCTYCSYACRNKQQLKTHQMKHTGEKPFKCPYCSFASVFKNNLLIHERTHNRNRILKCPDCNYTTDSRVNMDIHERKKLMEAKTLYNQA